MFSLPSVVGWAINQSAIAPWSLVCRGISTDAEIPNLCNRGDFGTVLDWQEVLCFAAAADQLQEVLEERVKVDSAVHSPAAGL